MRRVQRCIYEQGLIVVEIESILGQTRKLRRAGLAETVIMKIGGWRTRSVFER